MKTVPQAADWISDFGRRLGDYAQASGDRALLELLADRPGKQRERRDAWSTRLMGVFQKTGDQEAFALLYELNRDGFLRLIYYYLQRTFSTVSASDVLQEVFFNIYRYPNRFKPAWDAAFRSWANSIIRNIVFKHGRRVQRERVLSLQSENPGLEDPETGEMVDQRAVAPEERAAQEEAEFELRRAWMIYLHFYRQAYRFLTPREKRLLYLVEVEGLPYRRVAERLAVPAQNLKMMVFRARRRIYTIMKRKLQESGAGVAGSSAAAVRF